MQLKGSLESIQSLSQRAWRSLPLEGAECGSAMAKAAILECVLVCVCVGGGGGGGGGGGRGGGAQF